MAQAPTPGQERKKRGQVRPEDDGMVVGIVKDGKDFPVYVNRISGRDMEVIREALHGEGVVELIHRSVNTALVTGADGTVVTRMDPDIAALLECLSRRQNGEPNLAYTAVLDAARWGDDISLFTPTEHVEAAGDPND